MVGTDSHTNMPDALGCFVSGIGPTEMAAAYDKTDTLDCYTLAVVAMPQSPENVRKFREVSESRVSAGSCDPA